MCVPMQKETYTIFPVFLRKNRKKQDILHGKQSRYWNRTIRTQVNTISEGLAYGSRYHNIFRNNKTAQQHRRWIRVMKSNRKAVWLPCTVTVLTPYGLWMIVPSYIYCMQKKPSRIAAAMQKSFFHICCMLYFFESSCRIFQFSACQDNSFSCFFLVSFLYVFSYFIHIYDIYYPALYYCSCWKRSGISGFSFASCSIST